MKLFVVILCSLILETFAALDAREGEVELFHGPESFVEIKDTIIYARCQKYSEKFEKICTIKRISNIFNDDSTSTKMCPAILESKRRNTIVGSKLKVIPFGHARTIVVWVEKYEGNSTPREAFIKMTIINFDNNCSRRDVEISIPLEESENPDDSLDNVYLVTNDADDHFILTFYNEFVCGNNICKMSFDDKGNEVHGVQSWFNLKHGIIRGIVSLVRGNTEHGFLVFSDIPETYLVNESIYNIRKLDVYSDAESKIMYSIHNGSINLCYYAGSSFSCGRFNNDGELKLKRRFILEWDVVGGSLNYLPKFGLVLITYSNSESCKQTEFKEHVTVIDNDGFVKSESSTCNLRDFAVPRWIYNDKNEVCLFKYKLTYTKSGEELSKQLRCLASQISGEIQGIISKMQNTISYQQNNS